MITTEGFRTANDAYFRYVHNKKDTHKQTTPFILCEESGNLKIIEHTKTLITEAKENDVVLHTWLGQWSSDVVAFKLTEMIEYRLRKNII